MDRENISGRFVLYYGHLSALWLLQSVSLLPAMHKTRRVQMERCDLCHKANSH